MRTRHGFEPQEIRTVAATTRPAKPLKATRRKQGAGHASLHAATPGMEEVGKFAPRHDKVEGLVADVPTEEETASWTRATEDRQHVEVGSEPRDIGSEDSESQFVMLKSVRKAREERALAGRNG